jgi:hypothetical protein
MYNGSITANAVTPSVNMKNRIINGAMVIDQRNAGASVSNVNGYTVDRWSGNYYGSGTGRFSAQRSTTAPTGFVNSLLITITTADGSPTSNFGYGLYQSIEGFNMADFMWGTANAQTVTLSFWVRSSVTGTFPVTIINSSGARAFGATYTISAANTFEYKTVTIVGDTSGTWLTDNSAGLYLNFGFGGGAGRTINTGWQAGSVTPTNVTGSTQLIATNGATFYITGVQLEVGSTATSFDYRPYGTELALCQRYYWKATGTSAGYGVDGLYGAGAGNGLVMSWGHPVTMRASPTATADYNDLTNCTIAFGTSSTGFRVILTTAGSGRTAALFTSTGYVSMSAEL